MAPKITLVTVGYPKSLSNRLLTNCSVERNKKIPTNWECSDRLHLHQQSYHRGCGKAQSKELKMVFQIT